MGRAPGDDGGSAEAERVLDDPPGPGAPTFHDVTTVTRTGRVEVIAGPMFAGKSEELIRRVRRAHLAGLRVEVLTHALDTRYAEGITAHTGDRIPARAVADAPALRDLLRAGAPDLLAIDEAQFFGPDLVDPVLEAARAGSIVVVAGLSVTFDGDPFPPLPALMALAEDVRKLTAVCSVCGRDAAYHQRIRAGDEDGLEIGVRSVGGAESYRARCLLHHERS
ncbi:thymidine kinase [Brachybacterium sp. SGAir0954]|nr:thymidine kinase [Brachybacterium sp. SGAir0954]